MALVEPAVGQGVAVIAVSGLAGSPEAVVAFSAALVMLGVVRQHF